MFSLKEFSLVIDNCALNWRGKYFYYKWLNLNIINNSLQLYAEIHDKLFPIIKLFKHINLNIAKANVN